MNYETNFAGDLSGTELDDRALQKRRRWIIAAVVIVVAIAIYALVSMFGGNKDSVADAALANAQQPLVTVMVPGQSTVDRVVTATGSLAARREMPIGVVGEGGQVTRVLVEPGDWVRAGQVLAVIERSVQVQQGQSLAASVAVARADARLAQAELERAQALVARGFISQADIDRKTATRDAANARVNVAIAQSAEQRARTGRLDIRAPAAGLVLTRAVEPGQVVGAGSGVLFRLAKGGEMELLAQVSEADLARLSPGVTATVKPVGGDRAFTGQVWQVSPVVDPQSRQGIARIALAYDMALRPGGFAAASIISGSGEAPVLPESAVLSDEKGNYVFIVNDKNAVERRNVQVGEVSNRGVAVTNGITGRERIVVSAGAFLSGGQKVRPEIRK